MRSISREFSTGQYTVDVCCMSCIKMENNCKIAIKNENKNEFITITETMMEIIHY